MTTSIASARLVGVAGSEPRRLENYVRGAWVTGGGRGTDLFHAVTGAKIAEASTEASISAGWPTTRAKLAARRCGG